jgi:hypothetical protein
MSHLIIYHLGILVINVPAIKKCIALPVQNREVISRSPCDTESMENGLCSY